MLSMISTASTCRLSAAPEAVIMNHIELIITIVFVALGLTTALGSHARVQRTVNRAAKELLPSGSPK